MDPYPLLGMIADQTSRVRLGTLVTNPVSRHPTVTASALATLNRISGERMELGIGRGDGAVRQFGSRPATVPELEHAIGIIRTLAEGKEVTLGDTKVRLPWVGPSDLRVWVAGYGPRVIDLAARIADGVIFQLADPLILQSLIVQLKVRVSAAGRAPGSVHVMAAAPAFVGSVAEGVERSAWFPKFIRHHIIEVLEQSSSDIPAGYSQYIDEPEGSALRDMVLRTCLVGDVDSHVAKLADLRAIGVDQVNLYLMDGREAEMIEAYRQSVIPAVFHNASSEVSR